MLQGWETELIANARHATLGTIGVDGRPHLVPVCYAYLDERFVIAIDEKPKSGRRLARLRNIERDARVVLLIERYDDDWTQLAWIRIDGLASIRDRGDEWPEAPDALRERYRQYQTMDLEASPLIVVGVERSASWRWTTAPIQPAKGTD